MVKKKDEENCEKKNIKQWKGGDKNQNKWKQFAWRTQVGIGFSQLLIS